MPFCPSNVKASWAISSARCASPTIPPRRIAINHADMPLNQRPESLLPERFFYSIDSAIVYLPTPLQPYSSRPHPKANKKSPDSYGKVNNLVGRSCAEPIIVLFFARRPVSDPAARPRKKSPTLFQGRGAARPYQSRPFTRTLTSRLRPPNLICPAPKTASLPRESREVFSHRILPDVSPFVHRLTLQHPAIGGENRPLEIRLKLLGN